MPKTYRINVKEYSPPSGKWGRTGDYQYDGLYISPDNPDVLTLVCGGVPVHFEGMGALVDFIRHGRVVPTLLRVPGDLFS